MLTETPSARGNNGTLPELLGRMIAAPGGVFVSHTPPLTFQPDLRAAVEDLARRQGFEEQPLTTISDRNGRPTFDVFRFRKLHL